jgi:hypothetical protein
MKRTYRLLFLNLIVVLAASAIACGDSADSENSTNEMTQTGPAYAIATTISGDQGSTTYIAAINSLDIEDFDLEQAHEYPGWATIGGTDGMLFVSDGEAPKITRYEVYDNAALKEDGSLSFTNYGLATASFFHNVFVDPTTAYMHLEEVSRVVWNPTEMVIEGEADAPGLDAERDGLTVRAGFGRAAEVRDGFVYQSFYWTDADYYLFAPQSQIAVYDAADDSLVKLIDAPCPGLDVATQDEEGNLYFSNWVFSAAAPLIETDAPETCTVRINAGEQKIDEAWTRSFTDLTGGNSITAFRYLKDGKGIAAVLNEDALDINADTDPTVISGGANWQIWLFDLENGTAEPIAGLDGIAGAYYAFTFEGRTFLLLPAADYASTTVFEIADGEAVERFTVPGWAYQFVKVR